MGEPEVGNPRCKGTECLVLKYLLCRHGCDGKSIAAALHLCFCRCSLPTYFTCTHLSGSGAMLKSCKIPKGVAWLFGQKSSFKACIGLRMTSWCGPYLIWKDQFPCDVLLLTHHQIRVTYEQRSHLGPSCWKCDLQRTQIDFIVNIGLCMVT